MTSVRHGLSIGIERVNDHFYIAFKAAGKLTHEDYEKITPMIDSALEGVKEHNVIAYVDVSELEGWELRAAWDDLQLGLKHGNQFGKIAIFGNKKWQEYGTKISSWFISGDTKYFEDSGAALSWLQD